MEPPREKGALRHAPFTTANQLAGAYRKAPYNQARPTRLSRPARKLLRFCVGCGIAARLSRLRNTREVGASVAGRYLRLFDSTQRPNRLKRLLTRFVACTSARDGVQPAPAKAQLIDGECQGSGYGGAIKPRPKSRRK